MIARLRLLAILLPLLAACAGTARDPFRADAAPAIEWPAAPEPARVRFVASVTRHQDLFTQRGFGAAFARVFAGEIDSRMIRPYALAIHPGGALLVTDPGAKCVHYYNWAERKYLALGSAIDGGLPSPVGVAVARDGTILVSDSRRAAIERFDTRGRHLGTFAAEHSFQRPAGIAVDPVTGHVFAADVLAHSIAVFSPDGHLLRTIGANGSAPAEFNFPTHIAIDPARFLLVADSMNFRIQRLTLDGAPVSAYGSAGDARGDFARPKGVAAARGVTIAVEGLYDSLVFSNSEGDLLMTLGGPGSDPGQFWLPAGLAFDHARNLLFVADSYNSRVQVFRLLDTSPPESAAQEVAP